jgi:tetratricopeptide (TPR) repeat protein
MRPYVLDERDHLIADQLSRLGDDYLATGDAENAIESYEAAISHNASDWTSRIWLAYAHLANGDVDESLYMAKTLLVSRPNDPDARNLCARAAQASHDYRLAEELAAGPPSRALIERLRLDVEAASRRRQGDGGR